VAARMGVELGDGIGWRCGWGDEIWVAGRMGGGDERQPYESRASPAVALMRRPEMQGLPRGHRRDRLPADPLGSRDQPDDDLPRWTAEPFGSVCADVTIPLLICSARCAPLGGPTIAVSRETCTRSRSEVGQHLSPRARSAGAK
jgi:hypothetical protein